MDLKNQKKKKKKTRKMQHEKKSEKSEMGDSKEYLAKLEHVRSHAPFLLTVLKSYKEKTKQNSDQQTNYLNLTIDKIESMYKLLTNKDKQLPLNIIEKCEGFVSLMKKRLKPSTVTGNGNSSPSNNKPASLQIQPSAPASPPPSSDMDLERREPIIIPTERCENFSPQPSQKTTNPKRPVSPRSQCRTGNTDTFESRHVHEQLNPNHRMQHHRHQQMPMHQPPCPHPPLPPPPSLPPLPGLPNSRSGPAPLMNVQMPPRPTHFLPQQCFNRPGFQMHSAPYFPPPPPQNIPRNYPAPHSNPQQLNSTWGSYHQQPPPRAVNLQNLVTVPINDTVHRKDFVKSPSPIVDVLKSPPLTADDIDDLLHDTGASNEIPNRPKKEPPKPALSDFEAVRQKLIKSMCSSNRQSSPKTSSPKISHTQVSGSSPMPDGSDRIANKYNPHPRKAPVESESLPLPVPAPLPPQMSTPVLPSDPRSRPDTRVDPRLSKSSFIKPNDPRLRNDPRLSNFQPPEPLMMQKTPLSNFHMPKGCDPHSSMSPINTTNIGGMSSPSMMSPRGRIPSLMSLDDDGPPRTPIYTEPNYNSMSMNSMNQMSHANKSNKISGVPQNMNRYKWVNISGPMSSPRNSFQSPGDNKFHPMLNDQHERTQYLNSRKRKSEEYVPQTYGEHKEALRLAEEMEKRRRSSSSCSGKPELEDHIMSMIRTNSDESKNRRMPEKQNAYFDRRRDSGRSDNDRSDNGRSESGRSDSGRGDSGRSDNGRSDNGRGDSGRSVSEKGRRSHTTSSSYDNDSWDRDRNSHGRRDERRKGGKDDRFTHKSPVTDKEVKETNPKTSGQKQPEKERKDEPPKKIAKNISKIGKIKKNPMRISSDEDWDKYESNEEAKSIRKDNQKKQRSNTERDEESQITRKENQKKRHDSADSSDEIISTRKDSLKKRKPGDDKGKEEKLKPSLSQPENKAKAIDNRRRSRIKSRQQEKAKSDSSDNDDDNIKLSKLVPKKTRSSAVETEEKNDAPAKEVGDIAPIIEKIKSCFPSAADAAQSQLNLEEMLRGALAPLLQKIEKAQTSTEKDNSATTEKPTAKLDEEPSAVKETKKTLRTRKKKVDPEPEPELKQDDVSATSVKSDAEEEDDGQHENDNGDDASAKGRKNRRIRSELDRLQEDTHDMFMLQGGISSTGRRRCTLGKVTYGSPEEVKTKPESKAVRVRGRASRGAKEVSDETEKESTEVEKQELPPTSINKGRGRPKKLASTPDSSNVDEDTVKKAQVSSAQKPPTKKNRKKNIWVKTRRRRRVLKKNLVAPNREENEEEEEEQAEEQENEEEVDEEHVDEKEGDDTIPAEVTAEIEAVNVIRDECETSEVIIPEPDEKDEDPLEVPVTGMDTSAPIQDPLENAPHIPFNLMDEIIYGENENNLNVEKERTLLLLAQERNIINGDEHRENDDANRAGTSSNHEQGPQPETEAEASTAENKSETENASTQAVEPDTESELSKLELKEEKLSDDEFESSMECNNSSCQKDDFKSPTKKRASQIVPHKNIIKEMHCNSTYANKCVYCSYNGRYLSNHYSHHHPQSEVLISRFPQETVDRLKKGVGIDIKSSVPKTYRGTLLTHTCPFCQVEKSFTRICWIEHLGTHTGEYTFNCSSCRRPANDKIKVQKHCQTVCPNASVIRNRKLINAQSTIKAYVCDLCNYVQLDEKNMDRHLEIQHEVESVGKKTEIVLLNYPEFVSFQRQRSKGGEKKCDTILIIDPKSPSPPAVDSLNKEQLEVFLPRGDDGLNLDKNMLQLMSEISFSSSDKAGQPPAKTIADTLKARFNNVDDDKSLPEKCQKTLSMADRLTERFRNMKKDEEKEAKNDAVAPSSLSAECATPSNPEENREEVPAPSASTSTLDTEEKDNNAQTTAPPENETTEDEKADMDDDNDAEWEDIEEIPEPSCPSVNNKKKSNKLYYETVSRLYAKYITQPNIPKKTKKGDKLKKSQSVTSNDESSNSCSAFSTASTAELNEKREKTTETSEAAPLETPENTTEPSILNGSSNDQTTVAGSDTPSSGSLLKAALDAKPTAESPKPSCLSLLKAALDLEEDPSESERLLSMRRLQTPVKRLSLKAALELDTPAEGESLLKAALDLGSQAVSDANAQSEDSQKNIVEPSHSASESSVKIAPDLRPKRSNLKEIITKTVGVREMKKVENIGFTEKIADMIECKCLVKDCTFVYVNDLRSVVRHFANNHPTQRWSGFCQTCEKTVETTSQLSIAKELLHINDAHVKGLLEKYKVECKVDSNRRLQVGSSSLTLIPFSSTPNRTVIDTEPKMQICSPLKFSSSDEPVTPENTPLVKPIENPVTPPVKVVDGPKPTLKVRRLSGDRLSRWEDGDSSAATSPQIKTLNTQMGSETKLAKTVASTICNFNSTTPAGPSQLKTPEEGSASGTNCPLRPWLNSPTLKCKEHIQEMLSSDKLFHFYKCMGNECKFTASASTQMLYHLKFDHNIPQVIQKGEANKYKFLECAYCDMFLMNTESLVNHIIDTHSSDVYQCQFCFYRSVSEYNVQLHLKAYHPLNIPSITMCTCQFQGPRQFERHNIYASRRRNVRQLSCAECSATFYVIKDFEAHLRAVHFDRLKHKCTFCLDEIRTELIPGHLLKVHNIGLYECIYCLFATNKLETIGPHVADRHPSRFPIICARLPYEAVFLRTNEDDDKLNTSTVLVNLNKATKDDKIAYQVCKNEEPNELASHMFESNVVGLLPDVLSFENFTGLALKEVIDQYNARAEEEYKLYQTETNKIVSREKPREPKVQINNQQISQQGERRNGEDMMEVVEERAAADKNIRRYVENTGYSNIDIYRCPIEGCKDNFPNAMAFYGHSMKHSRKRCRLRCSFCNNYETTDWKLYRDHVVVHSRHRYFCYYCMKTGYSFVNITQHINNAHDVQDLQMCPLIPNYTNEYEDFFIIAPMDSDSDSYMYRVMCHIANKRPELKMYFMPDEVDMLPRQAIFIQELYCGIEKYKTKVRTNMLRHMSRHANEDNVQTMKQDAVNPVPCLESNERHFDKMTNLACSSFESKGGKKDSPKNMLPAFVDEPRRYVCGAPNCNYLTLNCEMLKCHLATLHSSEKNYMCPHCKREVSRGRLCADKIVQHLKFHDTNLFACSVCRKVHYFRHVIERHIQEKHRVDTSFIIMYSRTKELTTQSVQNVKSDSGTTNLTDLNLGGGKQKRAIWLCSMCNCKLKTRLQMELHAKHKHNVVHQFSCRRCNTFVKNISEHTKIRHPSLPIEAQCFYTRELEEVKPESLISPPRVESSPAYDTTPLWRRDPNKIKSIRGILFEDDSPATISKKPKAKVEKTPPVPKSAKIVSSAPLKCTIFDDNSRFCHDCDYVAVSTERLIDHIKVAHNYPLNEFIYYYGLYKFKCVQCDRREKFSSIRKFFLHYDRYHIHPEAMRIPSSLKLFSLCKIYTCYHCKETGTHDELKIHYGALHSNQESLILRDGANFTKCGLCDFKYYSPNHIDTLKEHYLRHHSNISVKENQDLPYISIPKEVLSYHMKEDALNIRCIRCNLDFSNQTDFDQHHNEYHGVTAKSFKILRLVKYVCPECFKQFQLHESVLRHVCREHCKISAINPEIQSVLGKCERILVVFPSGLTLRRGDLQNTEYGNVEHVKAAIADIQNFTTKSISPPQSTSTSIASPIKPETHKLIKAKTIWVNLNNENCDTITYAEFLKTHKELRIHVERINLQDLPDRIRYQTENTSTDNPE